MCTSDAHSLHLYLVKRDAAMAPGKAPFFWVGENGSSLFGLITSEIDRLVEDYQCIMLLFLSQIIFRPNKICKTILFNILLSIYFRRRRELPIIIIRRNFILKSSLKKITGCQQSEL